MNVQFHHPEHLWALLLIAIPIIVHLFNFRRHKLVYFSNVRFLKTIKLSTKNYSKLQRLLIMIARVIVFASIIIAFAQPYIPKEGATISDEQVVGIYIDNSFSMNTENAEGRLLDFALNQSRNIIKAYSPQTPFVFLNNDEKAEHFHVVDRKTISEEIMKTQISASVASLSKIRENFLNVANELSGQKKLYILSDFQKSTALMKELEESDEVELFFVPLLPQSVNNLSIDSCWFSNSTHSYGQDEVVNFKIKNYSEQAVGGVPIKLFINDTLKSLAQVNIEANKEEVVQMTFKNKTKGAVYGRAEIQDFPVSFDNTLFFSYYISPKIKVMQILGDENGDYISPIFEEEGAFELSKYKSTQIDYSKFSKQNCIILNGVEELSTGLSQELINFVENGNTVFVIPSEKINIDSYNYFLSATGMGSIGALDTAGQKLTTIIDEDPLYDNVFDEIKQNAVFPDIKKMYTSVSSRNQTTILRGKAGNAILSYKGMKAGRIFLLTVPYIEDNRSFISHPVSLPSIYNAALYSTVKGKPYYTVGGSKRIDVASEFSAEDLIQIKENKSQGVFIPQRRKNMLTNTTELYVFDNITKDGHYSVEQDQKLITPVSFNFSRKESAISSETIEAISEFAASHSDIAIFETSGTLLTEEIKQSYRGEELSIWLIIMALFFVCVEVSLIRFWRIGT